jgi:ATP-binding cassette subfamily C (CFTR/MRP) protein 1
MLLQSSLLHAMLGAMDITEGSINKRSDGMTIAYVAQQAWIQNITLKENILFDQPYVRRDYKRTIEACALQPDLDMLTSGDSTEIGENGINLSGGQKQRVSIARAVYANTELYLMDDPLSAVDAHVGKHIFENVLSSKTGVLKDKTRIIATNSLNILKHVDHIVVLRDGVIGEQGTYRELMSRRGAFADYLTQFLKEEAHIEVEDLAEVDLDQITANKRPVEDSPGREEYRGIPITRLGRSISVSSDTIYGSTPGGSSYRHLSRAEAEILPDPPRLRRTVSQDSRTSIQPGASLDRQESTTGDQVRLIEEEAALTGRVKWSVYWDYAKSVGLVASALAIFTYALGQSLHTASNVWLSYWSDYNADHPGSMNNKTSTFLGVYAAMGCSEAVVEFSRDLMLFLCCAKASKVLHRRLLHSVMRSPMSFFDTNPTGRIVNRFSSDIDTIDLTIPFQISDFLWCACEVISVIIVISYSTPKFLYVIVPLFIVYLFIQRYYIKSSRQIKRLESISKSPIFSHFTESVTGATTIRAYGHTDRFVRESEARVGTNVVCNYLNLSSNRWIGIRIETLGNLITFFAALFAILGRDTVTAGLAGLSISYAMQITDTLNWMVRMICDLETNCVALERVLEYITDNPQEAKWESDEDRPLDENWPSDGRIELFDYQTRYRPGLELVLKGISIAIDKKMKVGICGRTGAGKSSLTLALFRLIEPASGCIVIDGQDISQLGLHDLRARLTIIPQDPVLFTGNVRFNLDPTEKRNDDALWQALEHAHLKAHVESLEGGLDHEVSEGGTNFSMGQRQLVCLARALLRKTKILVLDEATAAIDMETDDLIQKTIRREFKDCTVITIAHRLNTILDSDAIAVLSDGKLIEFDKPSNLLNREDSALRSMANDANIRL